MVSITSVVRYIAKDDVSPVVRRMSANERRAADASAKAVVASEIAKTSARQRSAMALGRSISIANAEANLIAGAIRSAVRTLIDMTTASEETAQKIDQLGNAWNRTKTAISETAAVQDLWGGSTQAMTDILDIFTAKVQGGNSIIGSAVTALSQLNEVALGFSIPAIIGLTNSLDEDQKMFGKVQEGARAAAQAIDIMSKAAKDAAKLQKESADAAREWQRGFSGSFGSLPAALGGVSLSILNATETLHPFIAGLNEAADAMEELGDASEEFDFFGPAPEVLQSIAQDRVDAEKAVTKQLEEENKRSLERRVEDAKRANEQLVETSIGTAQAITQGVISTASSFAQAAEIEREAYEKVHGAHKELTEEEQILADASEQAGEIRANAMKQLASTALTEIGKIIAALVTQTLASGAATAGQAAQDASAKVGWPANMAVIPAVITAITAIFAGLVTSFAKGGPVTGGTPGRDSVPAMLMPGERVLTVDQNAAFERALGMGAHSGPFFAEGGPVGRNRPGQQMTVVLQNLIPERDAAWRRTVHKTIVPGLSEASRDGPIVREPRTFVPRTG